MIRARKISEAIFEYLDRGNTGIPIKGMYTEEQREMLMVIVSQKEVVQLRQIVTAIDPELF